MPLDQFGFLFIRQIHDAIGLAQEAMHSIKCKNISSIVMKIYLRKAYDKLDRSFITLVLLQIGLNFDVISWIIGCVRSTNYVILVNGEPSNFFQASHGIHQGFFFLV